MENVTKYGHKFCRSVTGQNFINKQLANAHIQKYHRNITEKHHLFLGILATNNK